MNKLPQVSLLTGCVILILLALYLIPDEWIERYNLRKVDLLSDIRPENKVETDSLNLIPELLVPDTCRVGLTCFVDYSPDHTGLHAFYEAWRKVKTLNRPLRIAFFSDSFTEGDIFSGDLRAELQSNFGGRGVGMMPLTSLVYGFRKTVIHRFGNWNSYSLIDQKNNKMLGISGNAFVPSGNSWVYYAGTNYRAGLDTCRRISIFYSLPTGMKAPVSYKINKTENRKDTLRSSGGVQRFDINETCGNISVSFPMNNHLVLYGVSLEDTTGVLVDNFSMRGSAGHVLQCIPQETLESFNRVLHYDLIILQYGLNVIETNRTKYDKYEANMIKTVQYLQTGFPQSSFLMIGISDRSMRKSGGYKTMPSIPAMNALQQRVCAETGIVFWNMFEAMGGEGSMVDFVNAVPPKANKDYTHLTFQGGAYLGHLLYETMLYEKERYDKLKTIAELVSASQIKNKR